MFSYAATAAFSIVSQVAASAAGETSTGDIQDLLSLIDRLLLGSALVALLVTCLWWGGWCRCDPLDQAPKRPNRVREDALALAVLVYLLASLAMTGILQLSGTDSESVVAHLFMSSAPQIAGVAVCLFIAAGRFEGGIRRYCFGSRGETRLGVIGIAGLTTILALGLCPVVLEGTVRALEHFAPDYEFEPHRTIQALHGEPQPALLVMWLWIGAAAIAPVAEEMFFRGLLQTALANALSNRWLAILLAAVAFAAVHFVQPHAVPALLLLAVLIGYSYERSGSLIAPIVVHAAFNLKTLVWNALGACPT